MGHQNRDRDPIRIGIQPGYLDPYHMNTDPQPCKIRIKMTSSAVQVYNYSVETAKCIIYGGKSREYPYKIRLFSTVANDNGKCCLNMTGWWLRPGRDPPLRPRSGRTAGRRGYIQRQYAQPPSKIKISVDTQRFLINMLSQAVDIRFQIIDTIAQCCGSGMFIPEPGAEFFPSRIPDPGQKDSQIRTRIIKYKILTQKIVSRLSEI